MVSAASTSRDPAGPVRTRRWFLAGTAATVVGGAAGVGAAFLRPTPSRVRRPVPAVLADALTAERALLAGATAARAGAASDHALEALATTLVADHTAHLQALMSAAKQFDTPRGPSSTTSAPAASSLPSRAGLREAEQAAATAGARRALQATGPLATVLASISACEASHAAVLQ